MKRNIVIAAVTTVALIGGGTATALAVSGDDGTSARQASVSTDDHRQDRTDDRDGDRDGDDSVRVASARVTAAEAIDAALARTPGTAVAAELDDDRGGRGEWEVDILAADGSWHSVDVNALTGKVTSAHGEDEDDTAEVRRALAGTSVSAAEAARAAAGQGTVTAVELEDDSDDRGWEIDVRSSGDEHDVHVDLNSGKVTTDHDD
ncbi:PepSY domain-containing protein [Streptomyces sp. NPDC087425]|uniref:PepSY domain-containing protein n=1 Tax=Streptomyces sp. NPDC087425 TaxID=3365787 RepID=UPI003807A1C7